ISAVIAGNAHLYIRAGEIILVYYFYLKVISMHKITQLFRSTCFLLGCIILFNGCKVKPFFPSLGNMTITLTGIFSHCYSHVTGTQVITYSGVVQPFYYNGSERIKLSTVSFNSGTNPVNPVVVNVTIPSDNTKYDLEIIINGSQCSKCAMQS